MGIRRSLSRRRLRLWIDYVSSAGGATPDGSFAEARRERQAIGRELLGMRLTVCLVRLGLAGLGCEYRFV